MTLLDRQILNGDKVLLLFSSWEEAQNTEGDLVSTKSRSAEKAPNRGTRRNLTARRLLVGPAADTSSLPLFISHNARLCAASIF
jgi:hypothetical protein